MQISLKNLRLDVACVQVNLIQSRNKAQELIKKGRVCVNGKVCQRVAYILADKDMLSLLDDVVFVSRAGEKLHNFLQNNPCIKAQIANKEALDIGASTGGFTQVLLQENVKNVVCVDVGSNQLHYTLREDCKVECCENTDIREFAKDSESFSLVVCDVSFISLRDILDAIVALSNDLVILLFKPQFEVGKEAKRNKKGVVKEKEKILQSLESMQKILQKYFKILVCEASSIKGKEGNVEFFIALKKS